MVKAIKHPWSVYTHPIEKRHHTSIVRLNVQSVNTHRISKTDRFMMSYAITDVINVIEFTKDVVMVILDMSR